MRRGLRKVLPALTIEFRLLPWHFGGEPVLSYAEAEEYLDVFEKIMRQRRDEMKKSRSSASRGSVRRGRRR